MIIFVRIKKGKPGALPLSTERLLSGSMVVRE
jgi:hypothetical protein